MEFEDVIEDVIEDIFEDVIDDVIRGCIIEDVYGGCN